MGKNNITPLKPSLNGVHKKSKNNYFMTIIKAWWPWMSMFLFFLITMNVFADDIYVSGVVWYGIQLGLVFGIFAMFKWGGPRK